ncbi:MAG: SusD/RagB family nutrient-binding outer membrane lipoprotein [Hymenobacter sp.]|nr:MAG: SusD/RagB family nutrient-binding outer membrane lipoprotein [Hymenobacter sp.]
MGAGSAPLSGRAAAKSSAVLRVREGLGYFMNNKQKIGIQKWIALYNQPAQAWVEWRRLDYPKLQAPAVTYQSSGIPLRYFYPNSEQNLNDANRKAAATAIGSDVVATKIFWDKL